MMVQSERNIKLAMINIHRKLKNLTTSKELYEYAESHMHIQKCHVQTSDEELIKRLLTQNEDDNTLSASTKFYEKNNFGEFIGTMFDESIDEMTKWLAVDANRPSELTLTISAGFIVGSGFKIDEESNTLKEYTTESCRIVLQYESNSKLNTNFIIKSAYPNIVDHEPESYIEETNRDINNIIKNIDIYKGANSTYKAYLQYLIEDRNDKLKVYPHYSHIHNNHSLKITIPTDDTTIMVSMVDGLAPKVRSINNTVNNLSELTAIIGDNTQPLKEINHIYKLFNPLNQKPPINLTLKPTAMKGKRKILFIIIFFN